MNQELRDEAYMLIAVIQHAKEEALLKAASARLKDIISSTPNKA